MAGKGNKIIETKLTYSGQMKNYRLTYDDAVAICDAHKNFNFYRKSYDVNGYRVEVFNYFLCGYNMFDTPIKDRPDINAFDMRGVTFVFNTDGTLYEKFLMLPKFFNINEVDSTQYHVLKNKKIKNISIKDDGSLIAFMNVPDGSVFAKTLGGFDNDQVKAAMGMYNENEKLQSIVKEFLSLHYTPLFEYVSFANKVVLNYSQPELKFIGIRSNNSHDYLPVYEFNHEWTEKLDKYGIKCVDSLYGKTLEELMKYCSDARDVEGFVVEFEDGQLVKCKTEWYFSVHKLHTESINREDYVISSYLNGSLDDILSQFDTAKDSNIFDFVNTVKIAIDKYIEEILQGAKKLYDAYISLYDCNFSSFATYKHSNQYFKFARCLIENNNDASQCMHTIKEHIIKKTFRLQNARALVEKYKNK